VSCRSELLRSSVLASHREHMHKACHFKENIFLYFQLVTFICIDWIGIYSDFHIRAAETGTSSITPSCTRGQSPPVRLDAMAAPPAGPL